MPLPSEFWQDPEPVDEVAWLRANAPGWVGGHPGGWKGVTSGGLKNLYQQGTIGWGSLCDLTNTDLADLEGSTPETLIDLYRRGAIEWETLCDLANVDPADLPSAPKPPEWLGGPRRAKAGYASTGGNP